MEEPKNKEWERFEEAAKKIFSLPPEEVERIKKEIPPPEEPEDTETENPAE
jgi:hypothetical protein